MPSEDSKTVMKKEEMECKEDDDDEICLSSMGFKKRKPVSSNNGTCAVKPQDKVKKDVPHSYVDNTDLKKKVKKVYDLPGQKRDPPEERDPLRIFYETLFKQNPNSEMALFWMMESGLLSKEEAKKAFEKKQNKTQHQKTSSQTKPTKNTGSAAGNVTKKTPISSIKKKETEPKAPPKQTKKRKIGNGSSDDTSDDDFIVNRSMKKK
uniref:Uncharacterized protein n=1 Tax=Cannabis sativa TaxID=3483 RepID=A0A803NLY1_CANSA